MRPLSITLEGFSAYRARQTLALEEAEFFSLSGPTGSGKSSLIDAMIFALYGRVPRLGARAVAPVITAGADRARVSLEFEVGGDVYVVSRVAERTGSGASVREARLEKGDGSPVASGAGDVTREVEELLRLRFDDFTKTVVLPQGEFARFLNAGSRERRELLRDLLGLDVYTRVRELANERRAAAQGRLRSAGSRLESVEVPDADELDDARERLRALEELSGQIEGRLAELEEAESQVDARRGEIERLDDAGSRVEGIAPPEHLEQLDERLAAAREAEAATEKALETERGRLAALEERARALPGRETIANVRHAHEELSRLDDRMAALSLEEARRRVTSAEQAVESAEETRSRAATAADAAKVTHAAHTVAGTLVVGEPCPVCTREVEFIPDVPVPPELTEVERAMDEAGRDLASRRKELEAERARLTTLETQASELAKQRESVVLRLADMPSPDELDEAENELARLSDAVDQAKAGIEELEEALGRARRRHDDAAEAVRSVGRALQVARELVADLKPPLSESDDPIVQWKDLLSWRGETIEAISAERAALAAELGRGRTALNRMREELVDALTSAGVTAEGRFDVQVRGELEISRNRVERLEAAIEAAEALKEEIEEAAEVEAVAGALAGHLRANGFERWLMAGAIDGLVAGANELLSQLSGGGYSLESDEDGSFRIVDHRNADEIRDVATLSGGETFLVSLSLSLSLAETLSGSGGTGLDAIILDEGFGMLDGESLETVAAVLEELAGRGLMVGVITHVKELAARAPVRYQVIREPGGSKVEMVT